MQVLVQLELYKTSADNKNSKHKVQCLLLAWVADLDNSMAVCTATRGADLDNSMAVCTATRVADLDNSMAVCTATRGGRLG